jgi:hypothetical protein
MCRSPASPCRRSTTARATSAPLSATRSSGTAVIGVGVLVPPLISSRGGGKCPRYCGALRPASIEWPARGRSSINLAITPCLAG